MNRYLKLKKAARDLMLAGQVDRYMHALRLMHGLRASGGTAERPVGLA
jgi:hypothetical protein